MQKDCIKESIRDSIKDSIEDRIKEIIKNSIRKIIAKNTYCNHTGSHPFWSGMKEDVESCRCFHAEKWRINWIK